MTSDEMEDKYPHWRTALFGNHNAVANIRCAIHYVFWHSMYAAASIIGFTILGAVKVARGIARVLGPLGVPITKTIDYLAPKAVAFVENDKVNRFGHWLFMGIALLTIATVIALVGYVFYMYFWGAVAIAGGIILGVVGFIALMFTAHKLSNPTKRGANRIANGLNTAGKKAVQTPGVRRVYGECPVSMDMAPKWFDNLFNDE